MDKLRRVLGGNDSPDEESGIMSQLNETTTLSWSTRLKAFLFCFILGILLSFLGSFALFLNGGLSVFAVFYTLGNILSMASTCFLMGPFNQIKKMFASTRAIATVLVIASFILTLVSALVLHNALLALIFIIIQSLAMTWYSLSYIPYARDAVKKTFIACIG
ncbi:vesicle transport protein SFT2B [Tribolium castaneum]|uniref:Vesicle transport protein n=1 Tax=Tribolium castaneum TaxID=7070 RepID=D6WVA7_TRICA|nr:PREDICTED: vesicle transport protein SFT2B [Tribolium castaneum]XP_975144.1 PREDICTED: vesicle transport protein SFT2B [Tribolium castaneum]EFA07753.1 Vesicle transport protein SFT2B-like Protein [Tribolium castaneum]|eukprot:XP_008197510.1 PREDICTED: vesicle transport protein SFT2B [Tribolium castaneum]